MQSDTEQTIEKIITDIADSKKRLLSSKLAELSNLSSPELEFFKDTWRAIEPARRRQIVHRLVELAEDNIEFNFDGIFKFCLKDEDANIRSEAIEGLCENEEPSLIKPLIMLLEQDSSAKVKAAAATALGKFALLAEYGTLHLNHALKVEEALLASLNNQDNNVKVRARSLEAISPLSLPQVKTAISEAHESEDSQLRVSAIYAMGRNCDSTWLPVLLDELSAADTEVRYEAAVACGELGEAEAVTHLTELINDPDIDVQIAAIQALGKIGDPKAKNILQDCLKSTRAAISEMARQALDELKANENPLFFSLSS
jgi:HEAT repeat protein